MAPEALREEIKSHHVAEYGLTLVEFHRRIIKQNGQCFICGATYYELTLSKDGFWVLKWTRHLDIDHWPGYKKNTRALLCHSCNKRVDYYERKGTVKSDALKPAIIAYVDEESWTVTH